MSELQKEIARIQKELKVPKSQRNGYGEYNYRSCEDILEAVKPVLGECSIKLSDDIVQVGDRIYVKAIAKIKLGSESDKAYGYAREAEIKKGMDAAQITGAASSYARKYALNGLFCIDDTRDADATNDHGKAPKKEKTKEEKELCFWGENEINKFEKMSEASLDAWGSDNVDKMKQLKEVDSEVYNFVKKTWAARKKEFKDAV